MYQSICRSKPKFIKLNQGIVLNFTLFSSKALDVLIFIALINVLWKRVRITGGFRKAGHQGKRGASWHPPNKPPAQAEDGLFLLFPWSRDCRRREVDAAGIARWREGFMTLFRRIERRRDVQEDDRGHVTKCNYSTSQTTENAAEGLPRCGGVGVGDRMATVIKFVANFTRIRLF